jgi:hypothetical protein
MEKKLTPVEWLEKNIKLDMSSFELIECFNKAKQIEIEQAVDLLTKYHDNLFYIPLKEGESERIYNHLNTIENDTNFRD